MLAPCSRLTFTMVVKDHVWRDPFARIIDIFLSQLPLGYFRCLGSMTQLDLANAWRNGQFHQA